MALARDGGDLSPTEKQKLDKWNYDEEANRMSTDASVRSGLNSFELGEMHTTHSVTVDIDAFDSAGVSQTHTHSVTVTAPQTTTQDDTHNHVITGGDIETAPMHIFMYWIAYVG